MSAQIQPVALVTGAATRLGRAMALALAQDGHSIAAHYHASRNSADELVGQIIAEGGRAQAFGADLTQEDQIAALVPAVSAAIGVPQVLINSASLFEPDDLVSMTQASWHDHQMVNLRAPIALAQAFAAHLAPGARGCIINMIDQRVWKPTPHFLSYAIAKAGLFAATQMLAQALGPQIRVCAIGPGPTLQNARQAPEDFAAQRAATLLKSWDGPQEIVRAMRYLLQAQAVTGQMIAVDGGQHLIWETPDVTGVAE